MVTKGSLIFLLRNLVKAGRVVDRKLVLQETKAQKLVTLNLKKLNLGFLLLHRKLLKIWVSDQTCSFHQRETLETVVLFLRNNTKFPKKATTTASISDDGVSV